MINLSSSDHGGSLNQAKKILSRIFFFQDSELNALDLGSAVLSDDFDRSNFIFRPAVTFLHDPDIEKNYHPDPTQSGFIKMNAPGSSDVIS